MESVFRTISYALSLCLAAALLAGCAAPWASSGMEGGAAEAVGAPLSDDARAAVERLSMEESPVLGYDIPEQVPSVIADPTGYSTGAPKLAYFLSPEIPERYAIVDDASGEVVYEGEPVLQRIADREDEPTYLADFGDFEENGTYRIVCEVLGSSEPFPIRGDFYRSRFAEALAGCEARSLAVLAGTEELYCALQAYEWDPELFPDEDGDGIPELLGIVRSWLSLVDFDAIMPGEECSFAAVLAKYGYLYRNFDEKTATDCVRKASALYSGFASAGGEDGAAAFLALAELYRASGQADYGARIAEYEAALKERDALYDEPEYLFGALAYMETRQSVRVSLCNFLMEELLREGEAIGDRHKEMIHPLLSESSGEEGMRLSLLKLACANYVVGGHQYDVYLEEILHRIGGRSVGAAFPEPEAEHPGHYLLLFARLARLEAEGAL